MAEFSVVVTLPPRFAGVPARRLTFAQGGTTVDPTCLGGEPVVLEHCVRARAEPQIWGVGSRYGCNYL